MRATMWGAMTRGVAMTLCLLVSSGASGQEKVASENAKAPDFRLKASDGKEYSLKDFAGKQAVVLAWYPKSFTGGCRLECLSMRDAGEEIRKFDVAYFTISCDDLETQKKWATELMLDYPVLSDPDTKVARAYGVVHEGRERPERWTFVIDKEGVVRKIDKMVNTKNHGADIAKALESLGVAKKAK